MFFQEFAFYKQFHTLSGFKLVMIQLVDCAKNVVQGANENTILGENIVFIEGAFVKLEDTWKKLKQLQDELR